MKFYFAPLEGITGFTFRNIWDEISGDVDRYYAPFISPCGNPEIKGREIRGILPENNHLRKPLVPQILANNPEYFEDAARQLFDLGYRDEININMGCPSGTVTGKNKGAGILRDPDLMEKYLDGIFSWREKNSPGLKLTVKTRIGFYEYQNIENKEVHPEFPDILEIYNKFPIDELIVHPRNRASFYRGKPDLYSFDYACKNSVNPVCYNGDINTLKDYREITERFDPASIMIGRGLVSNPFLIREIKGGNKVSLEELFTYHEKLYLNMKKIMKSPRHLLFKMKEYWNYIAKNFADEKRALKPAMKSQTIDRYLAETEKVFMTFELK